MKDVESKLQLATEALLAIRDAARSPYSYDALFNCLLLSEKAVEALKEEEAYETGEC